MADFIVLREWRGLDPRDLRKAIVIPEGKIISDVQYDIDLLVSWGIRLVDFTSSRAALLSVGDRGEHFVVAAMLAEQVASSGFGLQGYVLVQQKSDFPAPAGGVITLAGNTVYQINGQIDLVTDHVVGQSGTHLFGNLVQHDKLIYSGAGAAVRSSDGLLLRDLSITSVNDAFDISGGLCSIDGSIVIANRVGVFDVAFFVGIQLQGVNLDTGIVMTNTTPGQTTALLQCSLQHAAGGTGILWDLGATVWDRAQISNTEIVTAAGGFGIRGEADNGNLTAGTGRGKLLDSVLNGPGTLLVGITPSDIQWDMTDVDGIPDSATVGEVDMVANATATVIGVAGTFVKVAGTTTLGAAERFDDGGGLDNHLRYIGIEPRGVLITVAAAIVKTGGTVESGRFQVRKNGNPIGPSIPFGVSNSPSSASYTFIEAAMVTNDEFELFITNDANPNNITVTDLAMAAFART